VPIIVVLYNRGGAAWAAGWVTGALGAVFIDDHDTDCRCYSQLIVATKFIKLLYFVCTDDYK